MTPATEELRAKAKAAQVYDHTWYTADELGQRRAMPEHDAAYIAAANPTTILALIAERDSLLRERNAAAKDERAKIVAWLRHDAQGHDELAVEFSTTDMNMARIHKAIAHTTNANADAIERLDHLPPAHKPESERK